MRTAAAMMTFALSLSVVGCSTEPQGLHVGQTAVVSLGPNQKSFPMAVTVQDYLDMQRMVKQKDFNGYRELHRTGRIFAVKSGEGGVVSQISDDGQTVQIVFASGEHEGKAGWIDRTLIATEGKSGGK